MNEVIPVVCTVIVALAMWTSAGYFFLSTLFKDFKNVTRHDMFLRFLMCLLWPPMMVGLGISEFCERGIPWIKRKWKAFRAPKVEKKKEKAAAKIRMCPALKLKKYEQLLTEIETMHNRYYYHYIHDQVTEFARIRGGKPEVKAVLEVRPEGQAAVYFGRYNGFAFVDAQVVQPVVEAVEEWVAREEGPADPVPDAPIGGREEW